MKLALAFLLGMAAAICIQGRSQTGSDQSQSWHDQANRWLVVSGIAHHLNGNGYCNNRLTKGLGIEKDGYALGFYDNSNCDLSLYGAKSWFPLRSANWRLGLLGGVVSGYNSLLLPVAGFAATYERKTWGITATLIPPAGDSSGVLWMQWKKPW